MLPSTYSVEAGRNKRIIRERLELGSSLFFVFGTYKKLRSRMNLLGFFHFLSPFHINPEVR